MKTKLFTMFLAMTVIFAVGCNDETDVVLVDTVPAAPQGVYSVTGDGAVYIYWNAPYETDIEGFVVWRSLNATTGYVEIATVTADANPDLDLLIYEYIDTDVINGETYFYAVSSFDKAGQLSELSAENVMDTPRPEGSIDLFDVAINPAACAFDFSAYARVSFTNTEGDVYVDFVDGVYYLNVKDIDTDIQDVGYTASFDEMGYAPENGWSENGWQELILHHTYVIWTRDFHFAKMRVLSLNATSVTLEWAYQTDVNNPELVAPPTTETKPVHKAGYLNKSVAAVSAQ